jgi:hypothetical protein
VPLDWAITQNNLGSALVALGERESRTALLKEAVAASRLPWAEFKRAGITQYDAAFDQLLKLPTQQITQLNTTRDGARGEGGEIVLHKGG